MRNLKLAVYAIFLAGASIVAFWTGWAARIYNGDSTHLVVLIYALGWLGVAAVWIGATRLARLTMELCTSFGLVGTVIGFSLALTNLDLGTLSSTEGILAALSVVKSNFGTALYTTLVGIVGFMEIRVADWLAD